MRMRITAAFVAFALTGCAAQIRAEAHKGFEQCKAQFPNPVGESVARANCINAVFERYTPNDPLLPLLMAKRVELAERVDSGKMTNAEAALEFSELAVRERERIADQQARSAEARAAVLRSIPQPQPVPFYPIQMPATHNWNAMCSRVGTFTYCNGN